MLQSTKTKEQMASIEGLSMNIYAPVGSLVFVFIYLFFSFFFKALTARVSALELLVTERDARITALENALQLADSKLSTPSGFFLFFNLLKKKGRKKVFFINRMKFLPCLNNK